MKRKPVAIIHRFECGQRMAMCSLKLGFENPRPPP